MAKDKIRIQVDTINLKQELQQKQGIYYFIDEDLRILNHKIRTLFDDGKISLDILNELLDLHKRLDNNTFKLYQNQK
jgi:hypothetical protein